MYVCNPAGACRGVNYHHTKRDLPQHQKSPTTTQKEPYYHTKRALLPHQKSPTTTPKEPYYHTYQSSIRTGRISTGSCRRVIHVRGALQCRRCSIHGQIIWQKSPNSVGKETHIYLHTRCPPMSSLQNVRVSEEAGLYGKRALVP